jgi:hypothetical protein
MRMGIEHKAFEAEVKEFDEKDLTVTHFISTERIDRGNEVLYADGMKMDGKPVVLFQHGWSETGWEPIAKPLWIKPGRFNGKKGIQAKTQFWPDELGKRLWQKTTQGFMPNWSVGWRPLREEGKADKTGKMVRHVYEWELVEYSIVGVPMQPDAQTLDKGLAEGTILGSVQFKVLTEKEERRGELAAWKTGEDTWEMKPYPNEHACRLEDPGKYVRIRRETNALGEGVHALWGIQEGTKPVELQAIRLNLSSFTASEARAWLAKHEYKCKEFEPATGKAGSCGCDGDEIPTEEGNEEAPFRDGEEETQGESTPPPAKKESEEAHEKPEGEEDTPPIDGEDLKALLTGLKRLTFMVNDMRVDLDALKGKVDPAPSPGKDVSAKPPKLVIIEDESSSAAGPEVRGLIMEAAKELIQAQFDQAIDHLTGKVR